LLTRLDRVLSICAIEHFDDGEQALDEMARVLAPAASWSCRPTR
jgi:ubiquinone/menaquinone biosynthesis C-methylase UbiE